VPVVRQEIVGTLIQRGISFENVPELSEAHLRRLLTNLEKIFGEGKFSNSKSRIDLKDGELQVSFPFSQVSVGRMKGLDRTERAWDPEAKVWRVFVGCFDDVFDILGRGFALSEPAYQAIQEFMKSKYYASIAKGKMGKLIVREAWFEEIALSGTPVVPALPLSNAHLAGVPVSPVANVDLKGIEALVGATSFARKPFAHQLVGVQFLLANAESALLDEMGCGKSYQIASALALLFAGKQVTGAVIVAPMSLLRTWQEELRLAGIEDFSVVVGTPKQREKALTTDSRILIVHYEGLRMECEKISAWMKVRQTMLVFDESQRIKNLKAQTTTAAMQVRPHALRCVIATGTPIANRPLDLFSQYLVLDKGRTFGTKFSAFKNSFCEIDIQKIQVGRRKITVEKFVGVKNGPELHDRILRTSLRRLKSEVLDLPPLLYKDYVIELRGDQKTMYQQMRDNLRIEIQGMSAQQVKENTASIVVKLLRLAQIASNPKLVAPSFDGPNAKLNELDQIVEDVLSDDCKKIIVWSHFVENVQFLVEKYAEPFGAVGHTGDMGVDERQESIAAFRDNPACRMIVATPQSAKEGLTLLPRDGRMVADTMIYVDLSFDSSSYIQSQARFHRIGQDAVRCLVIHLVGEQTVDEYIRRTVVEKIRVAAQVLDASRVGEGAVGEGHPELGRDELLRAL
jgi:SNF2 family DNA or RNA helicase